MKNHFSFFTALAFISISIIGLSYASLLLMKSYPVLIPLFIVQYINTFACNLLVGIGIGLPLVFLASILGWVQLLLLVSGNINPHLAREGFFRVLSTLFSKI